MLVNKGEVLFKNEDSKYYKVLLADECMFCAVAFGDNDSCWLDMKNIILMCNVNNRKLEDYGFIKCN